MATEMFINLPVRDLSASMTFFTALGFEFRQEFTDDKAACMVVDDNIFVMLLVEPFFQSFTRKKLCDTYSNTEALIGISRESRKAVNDTVRKAVAAGGRIHRDPDDYGFMYQHGFEDLDGHLWELIYMRPTTGSQAG